MNDLSLSRLYRRLVASRPQAQIDVEDLVATIDATDTSADKRDAIAAKLASSSRHSDLARMLRALQPASRVLAENLNAERRVVAHPVRIREARPAAGARRAHVRHLRWAGAMAACLAVALGLWSEHAGQRDSAKIAASKSPLNDRIFTSQDVIFASSAENGRRSQSSRSGDKLFRGDFSGG